MKKLLLILMLSGLGSQAQVDTMNLMQRVKYNELPETLCSVWFASFPVVFSRTYTYKYKIGMDKKLHFYGTGGLTFTSAAIYRHVTGDSKHSLLVGIGSSLLISIVGKEILYDGVMGKGKCTKEDVYANLLGTAMGAIYFRAYIGKRINKNLKR